jgi:hypothetical protein
MRERVQTRDFRSHPPTYLSCVIYPFAGVENSRHLDVIGEHKIGRSSNPKTSPPDRSSFFIILCQKLLLIVLLWVFDHRPGLDGFGNYINFVSFRRK